MANGNNGLKINHEDKVRLVEKYLEQVKKYPYLTKKMFSINIGMSKTTFSRWIKEYEKGKLNKE
jgi:transposase-like protein